MKKIILIVGVVLISTIGVGAFSYFQGELPFSVSDEDVFSTMIENMSKNKTWHSKTDITINAEAGGEKSSILFNIEEDTDKTNTENVKSDIKINAELGMEGMSFSLGVNIKALGPKDIYLKITTIPALPFLGMLGINLDELKDQWIKIDQEYLGDITTEGNEEIIKQLTELLIGKEFLIVKERFTNEEINNLNCYHYLISLNKNELVKIIPEIFDIIIRNNSSLGYLSETEKEQTLNEAITNFNGFLDKIGDIDFEVWIGKKDKLLYQLSGEKEINTSEIYGEETYGNIDIGFKMNFFKFNQEININAPEEFKSLDEVFPTEMFSEQILETGI